MPNLFSARSLNSVLPYTFGNEIDYLKEIAQTLPPGARVVMLGVGPAIMAMALLEDNENDFHVYCIDIAEMSTARAHLRGINRLDRVSFILGDSVAESVMWDEQSIDCLIVDANHSYEGVKRDIIAWWPIVRDGGIIFFHDYQKVEADNGVEEAIDELRTKEWVELNRPGISIVFRKILC